MNRSIYYIGCKTDLYEIHDTGTYVDIFMIDSNWEECYLYSLSYANLLNLYDLRIPEIMKEFHKLSYEERKNKIRHKLLMKYLKTEDYYA